MRAKMLQPPDGSMRWHGSVVMKFSPSPEMIGERSQAVDCRLEEEDGEASPEVAS